MEQLEAIVAKEISSWLPPETENDKLIVYTQCLYKSGEVVPVTVERGFVVHDGGRTLDEILRETSFEFLDLKVAREIAGRSGLKVTDAWVIVSPQVEIDRLADAIVLVANASKDIAAAEAIRHPRKPAWRRFWRII